MLILACKQGNLHIIKMEHLISHVECCHKKIMFSPNTLFDLLGDFHFILILQKVIQLKGSLE